MLSDAYEACMSWCSGALMAVESVEVDSDVSSVDHSFCASYCDGGE